MGKVIYVTARPKTAVQQENVVVINPYRVRGEGSPGGGPTEGRVDTTLLDLMPFLESIVRLNVQDVQEVLESYKKEQEKTGMSIPEIFRASKCGFSRHSGRNPPAGSDSAEASTRSDPPGPPAERARARRGARRTHGVSLGRPRSS